MTNILSCLLTSHLLKRNEILDIILPVSIHHRHPPPSMHLFDFG